MRDQESRDALVVGIATGAYGLSFGALAVASGVSVAQACALSLLLFSGASEFAFVGLVGTGASALSSVLTATFLGARNAFYGIRLSRILDLSGPRRLLAAQLTIDESAAMAFARDDPARARRAFWMTGAAVFVLWNLATLAGALAATRITDPKVFGLDAAAPAAFIALLAPRLRGAHVWRIAIAAAIVALLSTPIVPNGVPVLLAAGIAVVAGWRHPEAGAGNIEAAP
jgi:predicted branched-subunit amino acid permease